MRSRIKHSLIGTIAACLATVSCAHDSPTAPSARVGPAAATRSWSPLTTARIVALRRTAPLPENQSASARIGILGGTLSLPDAGLTVVVPPLALTVATTITVTALAGEAVAYEFEPHGLHFLTPLLAIQNLRMTQAGNGGPIDPLSLFGAYFASSADIASVTETLPLSLDILGQLSILHIGHFSGYVWSSGRDATPLDDPVGDALRAKPRR